jgi:predicted double-glycine peptidase
LVNVFTSVFMFCLSFNGSIHASESVVRESAAQPVLSILEKRHHNVVLQQWELSCAAAALATVLRYQHGIPATERTVAYQQLNEPLRSV